VLRLKARMPCTLGLHGAGMLMKYMCALLSGGEDVESCLVLHFAGATRICLSFTSHTQV
jgi:hypothetical protein